MGKIIKEALVLFAITLVAGILLGVVYQVTLDPIAKANENAKQKAYKEVLADADKFEVLADDSKADAIKEYADKASGDSSKNTLNEITVGTKNGEVVGYVVTVTNSEGYGGNIKFSVGIDVEGKVLGISFLSISETAGLGMRAKQDPSFVKEFTSKTNAVESFAVVTDGSGSEDNANIDAIGGSTITTKAVTNGVNYALSVFAVINK